MGLSRRTWAAAVAVLALAWGAGAYLTPAYASTAPDTSASLMTTEGDPAAWPFDPMKHLDGGGGSDTGSDAGVSDASEGGPGDGSSSDGPPDSALADAGAEAGVDATASDSGAPLFDSGLSGDAALDGNRGTGSSAAGPVIEGGGCACSLWDRAGTSSTGLPLAVLLGLSLALARRRRK